MFEIGQVVMHPSSGICKVESVVTKIITKDIKKDYYVLKPIYNNTNTTIFLPVDCNKVGVREPISAEKIEEIMKTVDLSDTLWINDNLRREEVFYEALKSGEHTKLIQLICELHRLKTQRNAKGKQLRMSDSKVLSSAERIINEEFAYALNLDLEEAAPFIIKKLGIETPTEN